MATFRLVRDIPLEEGYDLVVAGGGPAGSAAAVCAARLGVRVLLLEATGCLGGTGTSGLVTAFDPMADGERMLVGGFVRELVETMYERGFLAPHVTPDFWRRIFHRWTPFRAEGLKLLLDEGADTGYIYFSLGNLYARNHRWADAQQAYFEALRNHPQNPVRIHVRKISVPVIVLQKPVVQLVSANLRFEKNHRNRVHHRQKRRDRPRPVVRRPRP